MLTRVVLGVTGSFGSGKSTVTAMFEALGAPAIDADRAAKDAVAPGSEGLAELKAAFGDAVIGQDGGLDRKKMAEIAFADRAAREKLNSIVHPRVGAAIGKFLRDHAGAPLVILDIPLLFEGGRKAPVDKVAVVTTDEKGRFGRLKRKGFSEREVIARLGGQMAQARKAALADYVIKNDGDLESTRAQVHAVARECGIQAPNPGPKV